VKNVLAISALFLFSTAISAKADEHLALPVFGAWECGIMSFTLDANIYNISGKSVQVDGVEKISEDAYGATMHDGYRFAMFDVTATTLTWHSPASGDTFECQRDRSGG